MYSFFRNSILGIVAVGCRLGSSFFMNKMVALYFGPAGIAQLAHFQNLLTFFTHIPNDGINRGLIKYLAGNPEDSPAFNGYLKTGLYLTAVVFGFTAFILVLGRQLIMPYFPPHGAWLSLFLAGALLLVIQSFFNAVLLARRKNILLVFSNMVSALVVVLFVAFAATRFSFTSFLLGYLVVIGTLGLIVIPFSLKRISLKSHWAFREARKAGRQLSTYILMAASVLIFSKGMEYYIRDYLIRHFSLSETGLWQGVVRLSDSYTAVYTAVLAFAFYPKVAALLLEERNLQIFVRRVFIMLIPLIAVGLGLVYLSREYLFTWLLSARFMPAQEFLPYQLAGDFFKLLSWVLANLLVAQAKFKVILLFEALSAFFYLGFFYFFTSRYGIAGSPMAHCGHYLIFFGLNFFYFRKLLGA